MRKVLYSLLLSLLIFGCNYKSEEKSMAVAEDESVNDSISEKIVDTQSDSLAIGNICLGIDESTFNHQKEAFLIANPSLNGRLIEEMIGEFYNGKLYSIIIRSKLYEEAMPSTRRLYSQEALDSVHNEYYVWSSLYKSKYKGAEYIKEDLTKYLLLKRGRCTIEVRDKYTYISYLLLFEQKEMDRILARGDNVPIDKFCSVIKIFDKSIVELINLSFNFICTIILSAHSLPQHSWDARVSSL